MNPTAAPGRGIARLLAAGDLPARIGLAVSGGSDSMAMLHLLVPALTAAGRSVSVATVDHGLRPEAAAEAEFVAAACRALGVPHATLVWSGWDGTGNLPAAARAARFRLLAEWARGAGLGAICLGHTLDDQAETVLLRLARGSGVDGLAAMAERRRMDDLVLWRPLLDLRRDDLRDWLSARGLGWIDDPGNLDLARDRVRARRALALLADLGITAPGLAQTAGRMALARDGLRRAAQAEARDLVEERGGALLMARARLAALPAETRLRLVAEGLRHVTGQPYRPRLAALQSALGLVVAGQARTLHGAILLPWRDQIVIAREIRPVAGLDTATDRIWDGRWRLSGPHAPDLRIRALGPAGLGGCPNWPAAGLPRAALLATPAVWRGADLVAAPLAQQAEGWSAQTVADFASFLKSD